MTTEELICTVIIFIALTIIIHLLYHPYLIGIGVPKEMRKKERKKVEDDVDMSAFYDELMGRR